MRLLPCLAILAAASSLAACVPQGGPTRAPHAILTDHGNRVDPTGTPGEFEVLARPGDGGAQLWCAAGEFAQSQLRASPDRRIYLVTPRGPSATRPGRTSAVFTVMPSPELQARGDAMSSQMLLGVRKVGTNFSTIHADMVCRPPIDVPD
ncbi:hypothetical protein DSD19_19815 [Rhodovulum sp. BSW8]|uniref:Lipoprotein n=1 Tax=Rhodovulum visakhapatnamense TaxID=364297 RepID=A0A4R8G442_9RHOB|nr:MULTISPECIES: hypothetical protein [Rhodovulum]OLS44037.1 hypothetical protein BV509_06545 [Rhodovulum sulfidophilum]MBL3569236.1 hypothetical protein [Rhodovulum visakhapatnamense]MBL3577462.1 hypothetical protein [Rhodovulum visakhapatnamense]RBO51366.1 hypothetical protein DSD19_19815 [Rhodovulum sp. BSW8]TDX31272.1 hypothetical protein EV657_105119 [Rhodovulum visakhapatnamense]